jgi:hypothetical protein
VSSKRVGRLQDGWGDAPVTDEVAFTHTESLDMGGNPEARVDVLVNGVSLSEVLFGNELNVLPLDVYIAGPHLERWAPGGDDPDCAYVEDGRVAVLTCGCGDFGCGGVTASIIFTKNRVIWTDFHGASHRGKVAARPLVFSRSQYTTSLDPGAGTKPDGRRPDPAMMWNGMSRSPKRSFRTSF